MLLVKLSSESLIVSTHCLTHGISYLSLSSTAFFRKLELHGLHLGSVLSIELEF